MANNPANMTMDELMTNFSEPPSDPETRYYGVQMTGKTEDKPIVLTKLPDPKKFLAICPTVRFKEFTNEDEALAFSRFDVPLVTDQSFKRTLEPRSPYPSPTNGDRDLLLTAIQAGDCLTVRRSSWKNPRLLVTPDDAPQCYRGTWRQTVLHLAVQAMNFSVFCTLMEVIDSAAFAKATQLTEFEDLTARRQAIVSNYLNNRNRKEESPLDCAVVYGMVEVVDFLTTGKSFQQWQASVCSKCGPDRKVHSTTIMAMLQGRWYLPLYKPTDPLEKSTVREVVPVELMRNWIRDGTLAGFIGPASEEKCSRLLSEWKEKTRDRDRRSRSRSRNVSGPDSTLTNGDGAMLDAESVSRKSMTRDRSKSRATGMGLKRTEVTGRLLAKNSALQWKEWWNVLRKFVDISSTGGMRDFEYFLANRTGLDGYRQQSPDIMCVEEDLSVVEILSQFYTQHSTLTYSPPSLFDPSTVSDFDSDMADVTDHDEDVYYTPPSSPEPEPLYFVERYSRRPALFIGGKKPCSTDYDVYEALKDVIIPDDFRYVISWKAFMARHLYASDLADALSRLSLESPIKTIVHR